jgi:hypothetical protein
VQWWVNNNQTWRIRTFDINSDIHVHEIKQAMTIDSIDELMKKRYSDILVGRYDFISISLHDNEIIINKMKSGSLETSSKNSFSFWNHDDRAYCTKTNPGNV